MENTGILVTETDEVITKIDQAYGPTIVFIYIISYIVYITSNLM
jgi:hypothetical protein